MSNYNTILAAAKSVKNETTKKANTAARVGGVMVDTLEYLNGNGGGGKVDVDITGTTIVGFVKANGTVYSTNDAYKRTDYISVSSGDKLTITGGINSFNCLICSFDSEKSPILDNDLTCVGDNSTSKPTTTKVVTVPDGVSYIIVSQNITYNNNVDAIKVTRETESGESFIGDKFPNKSVTDKFSQSSDGKLLWNNQPIEGGTSISTLCVDLPVSDGTSISSGYAYIDSTTRTIKVKP